MCVLVQAVAWSYCFYLLAQGLAEKATPEFMTQKAAVPVGKFVAACLIDDEKALSAVMLMCGHLLLHWGGDSGAIKGYAEKT